MQARGRRKKYRAALAERLSNIEGSQFQSPSRCRRGRVSIRVAIHGGHGIFTTDQTVDEAAWWFVLMNRCCEAQLLAQACGKPSAWSTEDARWLASVLGSPQFGWLSFQTLWDDIIQSDPDLVQ